MSEMWDWEGKGPLWRGKGEVYHSMGVNNESR